MQKGFAVADTGPKTRDISVPEEFWKFFQSAAQSTSAQPTENHEHTPSPSQFCSPVVPSMRSTVVDVLSG